MARQRGAIIRRGKIYYIKYRTPAGKQKWESGFPNRSQAQQRLNQLLGEITHGSYVEPKSTKFEKFAEEWLESRVAVRGSTLSSYGSIVRRRLIPHFGKMSLSEISYDQVQNFVNDLAKEVSVKTVQRDRLSARDASWQEGRERDQAWLSSSRSDSGRGIARP